MSHWHNPRDFLPFVDLEALLADFDYSNFSILKLVERVAANRQLPLVLLACPIQSPTCYGWWLTSPLCDFVFYEHNTFLFHQNHIICHELSHILLGHLTVSIDEVGAQRILEECGLSLSPLNVNKVFWGKADYLFENVSDGRFLMREMTSLHESLRESEAESLAKLLQRELIRRVGLSALTRPSEDHDMRQIIKSLGLDR